MASTSTTTTPDINPRNASTLTHRRDTYPFIEPYRFANSLTKRVVLVTCADRGLGRASALAFAAAGATLVCVGRDAGRLDQVVNEIHERYARAALALCVNMLDPTMPKRVVQHVEQTLGPVDVLVNVDSSPSLAAFVDEPDFDAGWWQPLEENLRAPIALIHAVLPSMVARRQGTIISTTFSAAVVQVPLLTAYSTAKAALVKFHHGLDMEARPKGVYSYVVHPGLVASQMHDPQGSTPSDTTIATNRAVWDQMTEFLRTMEWSGTGLGAGTFVALCADARAKVLSGKYIDAEQDLGEVIEEAEKGEWGRVDRERLYVLKCDEL